MDCKKLLEDLATDLGEIPMTKRAHIQVEQVLAHYRKRSEEKKQVEPKLKSAKSD